MPTWLTILLGILGGTGLLSLICKDIYNWIKTSSKKAREDIKRQKQQEMREVIQEEINPIKEELNEISVQLKDNTKATVTELRCDMKDHRDRYIDRGYATSSEKAAFQDLYEDYKSLGGNHFKNYVDSWKADVDNLPTEKIKKSKKVEE